MRILRFLALVASLFVVAACTSIPPTPRVIVSVSTIESPLATPSTGIEGGTPAPEPTLVSGQVTGFVVRLQNGTASPLANMGVRLGRVFWNADKSDGAFVFEGATSPSTTTRDDGTFTFDTVAPGDYVILIGDMLADHRIIAEDNGKSKIYSGVDGLPLDVGQLEVDL